MRHPVHRFDLVRVHVPDPVGAAGEQFGHLGAGIRHEAHAHLLDRGLALRAAGPVILEPLEVDGDAGLDLGHLVGTRTDRRLGVAFGADLLAIGLGIDRDHEREIFQRRGGRPLELDAHREIAGLLGLIEPVVVRRRRQPARRIGDQVDGVDDVVGGERAAVVEFDARAQREFDGGRIRTWSRRTSVPIGASDTMVAGLMSNCCASLMMVRFAPPTCLLAPPCMRRPETMSMISSIWYGRSG